MSDRTLEGAANPPISDLDRIFPGDSEMARRMRAFDWADHELGSPAHWPQSLKTIIRIILTSRQAMFTWWGKNLVNLYNDAYISVLGGKHPAALGSSAPDVWHEIWDVIGPRAETALTRDEGTFDEALLLIMERNGFTEETYFTFSYSPVMDDQGSYSGIFSPVTEDTQRIIGERQLALLRELSVRTTDARTWEDACTMSMAALQTNPHDIYWALIYMIDAEKNAATLAGTTNVSPGSGAAPVTVNLAEPTDPADDGGPWPLATVAQTRRPVLIADLGALGAAVIAHLPRGPHGLPAACAIALPLAPAGATGKAGILVVGLSPLRVWDDNYRRFLDLVTGEIAAAIASGHAYAEERRRAEALAELDRAKTTFFSNVSHEFRTPLALMLGPLEDVLGDELAPDFRRQVEMVHRNALRLLRLVNTLLDFARIEAARMEATYEPTDLAAVTTDLASSFRSAIEKAGMPLVVDCPPLPEPIYVDREMWEKIVLNLLSNAFKFTFTGEIAVTLRWCGDHVELAVRDTGVGIPPNELPHVFDRFHRVPHARGRTIEGTGIGLALVKELVRLHGGAIGVSSSVDFGSTFTISLPAGTQHLPADRIAGVRTQASTALGAMPFVEEALRWLPDAAVSAKPVLSSISEYRASSANAVADSAARARILVADDNADMRLYLQELLGPRWQVQAVPDGATALAAAIEDSPDLILSDIMMPGMDGFELLARLRADRRLRETPVILLSARAGDEARIEGMAAGADDYLVKPFSGRELLARVQAHLDLARVRREAASALRESEQRFRSLAELSPDGIWINCDNQIAYINPAAAQLLGVRPEDVLGRNPLDFIVPEHVERSRARIATILAGGSVPTVEIGLMRPDGSRTDADVSAAGIVWNGHPAVQVLLRDATSRKLAEATLARLADELEQQVRRFDAIADAAEDFIYTFDTEARITYASKRLLDLWHKSADDAFGKSLWELNYPAEEAARLTAQVKQVVATRKPIRDETIQLGFAAGGAAYEYIFTPIVAADGRVEAVAGISRDTTERRRFEQQLRQSEERLRALSQSLEARVQERTRELARSNKELDQFAYVASHDLKAPLRAIDHLANWISQDAADVLPHASREHLEKLRGRIRRMEKLLDDLLAYSRAGRHLHEPEWVDTEALARDICFMLAPSPGFALEIQAPMPTIYTERVPLETVLRNLVGNAIKHHDRPEAGHVRISATEQEGAQAGDQTGRWVEFTVEDDGPGIDPQHHERIFQIFQSLKPRDQVEGSGMGLAVVKKTVENQGGSIMVRSDGQQGSTFRFTWPLRIP